MLYIIEHVNSQKNNNQTENCHNKSGDLKGITCNYGNVFICLVVCLLILYLMKKTANLHITFPPFLLLINKIDGYLANIASLQGKVVCLASFKQALHHA